MLQLVGHLLKIVMQITQFLHAALLVADLDRAKHFYGQVLGLSEVKRSLKYPGAWYQIGAFQLHLIQSPTTATAVVNPEKLGRNQHLAFAVLQLDAVKAQLQALEYPIQMSASGRPALFTQDPDGNIIELGER